MATTLGISNVFSSSVLSVAIIGPDERRLDAVKGALTGCPHGATREFTAYPSLNDLALMLNRNYDVVMVDLDSDPEVALDLVENICVHGSSNVMVYSEQTNQDLLVRCMRAGTREFLSLPFARGSVAEALVRASARRPANQPVHKTDGSISLFLGAKGGTGVTTLACNFAVSLAKESAKNTLLIDLNLPLGDAAINLGIKAPYSTVDALQNASRLDPNFLATMLVRHNSGLWVLAAPSELTPFQASNEDFDRLVTVARQEFDYIVVDAGSRLDLQHTALFKECASIYLVTQVGIPELRNANRLIAQFSKEGGPKLEIVINRFDPRSSEFTEEPILKALTRPAECKVPNNYAAVRKMQNTATPLVLEDSPISLMIQQMAKGACGKTDAPEKKKGFSLFR